MGEILGKKHIFVVKKHTSLWLLRRISWFFGEKYQIDNEISYINRGLFSSITAMHRYQYRGDLELNIEQNINFGYRNV